MPHHHHHHGDDDHHDETAGAPAGGTLRRARFVIAFTILAAAVLSACAVLVGPGEAVVITRFGDPVRVITAPGLAWRLPPPIDNEILVDRRLRTTSSGLQDVGTRDGLRVLVQAYVAWQVPDDPDRVRQFLRAVRNQPDLAADQLRSFIGSALEITASSFDLANLVNTDPAQVKLGDFEQALRSRLDQQALSVYGIAIRQVGLERLTLPAETLTATVERMRAERATVAAQRQAEGQRQAADITSDADRDARIEIAKAKADAAAIGAQARVRAADIYGTAYRAAPQLYTLLRSLDTLDQVLGANTRVILRTDAAPFRALVDGPGAALSGGAPPASAPGAPPPAPSSPQASK